MLIPNHDSFLRRSCRLVLEWIKLHPFGVSVILLGAIIFEEIVALPYGDVNALGRKNPTMSAFMDMRADLAREQGTKIREWQVWTPLRKIPDDVINAVIVSEDGTFWSHHGFDWYEFRESVERNLEEGRAARGASTITQQLVKNLYLSPSKNPLRKLKEWILTWWMEQKLSKSRILEIYLNVIELGDGVYGVEAGSEYHFGKSVDSLSRDEAARLAAIIPNPRYRMAGSDSQYIQRRSALILERMTARGM